MLDQAFADIGLAFSQAFGGIFWPAQIITQGEIEYDDGGSIIPGTGEPTKRPCQAQVDGRRYRFTVTPSILQPDGAERDAYHGIASVVARAYQG